MLALIPGQSQTSSTSGPGLYEKGMNAIRGGTLNRNDIGAIEYLRKSADLGFVPAQVVLGFMYETGFSVAREPRRAADWYKKAAQQGDPLAAWLLGRVIYLGEVPPLGVNDAVTWLERAASDPFAQYLLGMIKLQKHDYTQAAGLFQKASERGLPQAQYELGMLLQRGPGSVKRDRFEAYVWLLMAANAGYGNPELQSLESDLGATRTEEAKTTARQRERDYGRSANAHRCTGWEGEFARVPTPPPPDTQQFCR